MDPARIRRLLVAAQVGRLATVAPGGRPHVVPFCFALIGERIVSAVDSKPKRRPGGRRPELTRITNIRANPAVEILVDHYEDDWNRLWWLRGRGVATIHLGGREWEEAVEVLSAKYSQYRQARPAGPVVSILVQRWTAWSGDGTESSADSD